MEILILMLICVVFYGFSYGVIAGAKYITETRHH